MEDQEKIEKLTKEIELLKVQKDKKDKVDKLLKERNRLRYGGLYSLGKGLKETWKGVENWADAKNKQMEEDNKQEAKEEKKEDKEPKDPTGDDIAKALFDDDETTKAVIGD